MPAKSAKDIVAAETAFKAAQALHQAALDSEPRDDGDYAGWVVRVEDTWDDLEAARFALLAAYGMPDASVNAARAAYAVKEQPRG